ncbi:unnamed protein product [Amoebophrya sp. A120]|nr:unnamed protein product [Amoebophrya sp. A120]|eukprot:GSA120T00025119001.1
MGMRQYKTAAANLLQQRPPPDWSRAGLVYLLKCCAKYRTPAAKKIADAEKAAGLRAAGVVARALSELVTEFIPGYGRHPDDQQLAQLVRDFVENEIRSSVQCFLEVDISKTEKQQRLRKKRRLARIAALQSGRRRVTTIYDLVLLGKG